VHCLHSDPTQRISIEGRRVTGKFTNAIFIPALKDIVRLSKGFAGLCYGTEEESRAGYSDSG